MNAIRFWRPWAAMVLLGAGAVSAWAADNPPIQLAQGIEYMCGGKTGAEAAFMKMVSPRWAASLDFSVNRAKSGDLPTPIDIVVRERYSGALVMRAAADAPTMLARLDPGAYDIEATMGGMTLRQPLVVFAGAASHANFVWPSNIDFAANTASREPLQQAAATVH